MVLILGVAVGAALIGVFLYFNALRPAAREGRFISSPYAPKSTLFTPAENKFRAVLEAAVGDEYQVYGKVRLEDIIVVKKGVSKRGGFFLRNRIKSRHVDFVVCKRRDSFIFCAIELDDSTHGQPDRQERDAMYEKLFKAVGIPLLRFPVRSTYDVKGLSAELSKIVERPLCPKCQTPMKHVVRSQPPVGQLFWGCVYYSDCKGSRDYTAPATPQAA